MLAVTVAAVVPPLLVTVSAIVVLADRLPLVPVIVTVAEPVAAELLAVSVNPLDPVVGLAPNDAVTPLGRPLAERETLPLNPFAGSMVMVLAPEAPCLIDRLLGESDRVKEAGGGVEPPRSEANRVVYASAGFDVPSPVEELLELG